MTPPDSTPPISPRIREGPAWRPSPRRAPPPPTGVARGLHRGRSYRARDGQRLQWLRGDLLCARAVRGFTLRPRFRALEPTSGGSQVAPPAAPPAPVLRTSVLEAPEELLIELPPSEKEPTTHWLLIEDAYTDFPYAGRCNGNDRTPFVVLRRDPGGGWAWQKWSRLPFSL